METRAHMVLIIRAIATSTRMTPDCLTRSQSSRTVAGGPEGATEVPQATQAPARGDDKKSAKKFGFYRVLPVFPAP